MHLSIDQANLSQGSSTQYHATSRLPDQSHMGPLAIQPAKKNGERQLIETGVGTDLPPLSQMDMSTDTFYKIGNSTATKLVVTNSTQSKYNRLIVEKEDMIRSMDESVDDEQTEK